MFQKVRGALLFLVAAGLINSTLATPIYAAPASKDTKKDKTAPASSNLKWYRIFSEASKAAKDSKKWILIDVYTDYCPWCVKLDQDTYSNPRIMAFLNRSFVCMKADAEKGDGVAIKAKYGIEGFPCTIIVAPNGKSKGRIYGYMKPQDFPQRMAEILQSPKEFVLYL